MTRYLIRNMSDMSNIMTRLFPLKQIEVRNFKSLRNLKMDGCKRINLLIGRPNVGKSNLIEALSLFCVPCILRIKENTLHSIVRADHLGELFFDGNQNDPIQVTVNDIESVTISSRQHHGGSIVFRHGDRAVGEYGLTQDLELSAGKVSDTDEVEILTYRPSPSIQRQSFGISQLLPPSGTNLMEVVRQLPQLKDEVSGLMTSYGLKMVYDSASQELKAMKEKSDEIFLIPFSSLADSLQRLIFYKAAIQSNHDKVICLEEPETHTFPPYVASLVQEVIDAEDNQFFISTHSPYVANSLMEALGDDLAIYLMNMVNGETTVKRVSDEEVQEMYDNGVDLFFTMFIR